jgi:hypothetical protein
MKKLPSLLILLVLLSLLSGSVLGEPKLVIPDSTFNFGFVPQNSKISHKFWLHSLGTDTLKIVKVSPGCGCTQTPLTKTDLAPGDSTELETIFNTGNYMLHQSKRPSITTNEGLLTRYVQFSADVVVNPDSTYPLIINPYKFDISQFGKKERNSLEFVIKNVSDMELEVRLVDMPSNMFKLTLPKKIKPGETAKGKITLLKEFLGSEFEKSLTLETTDKLNTRFTIPVKRIVRIAAANPSGASPN